MKLRLLAADSDPILRDIYRRYFPNFGIEVATAIDGVDCVQVFREFMPDILVLSLELQWGGAEGVLSLVREEALFSPIPVVLTIDGISRSKATTFLRPPIVKLLEKPFRLRDLRAIIESAVDSRSDRPGSAAANEHPASMHSHRGTGHG